MTDTTSLKRIQVDHDLTKTIWPSKVSRRWGWLVAVVTIVSLFALGWWTSREVENSVRQNLQGELTTLIESATAALELWREGQLRNITVATNHPEIRQAILQRIENAGEDNPDSTSAGDSSSFASTEDLSSLLARIAKVYDYTTYVVTDRYGTTLAASHDRLTGTRALAKASDVIDRALEGEPVVSTPFRFDPNAAQGTGPDAVPMVFVAAPLKDQHSQIQAVLAFGTPADRGFTRVLDVSRSGESGETYAIDRNARLVSDSRFDVELRQLGLIQEGQRAILNLQVHDPGGNLNAGFQPKLKPEDWPRTMMAIDVIESADRNNDHVRHDLDGYRDYRGVQVIGAWRWLPEMNLGIATELDLSEAYHPLHRLQTIFATLFVLLCGGIVAALVFAQRAKAWQHRHLSANKKLAQLGQYKLEKRIGRGGMGDVYRAQHMLLRRPTAVKLLRHAEQDDVAVARFEREVHHTSQLTHPNTIAVYDFGLTPDGIFYYAMEYLEGATCKDVVNIGGPMPESRVIHVLAQVCGSLAEAHARDLIHRDIKPANIMLCERGGIDDFVKVLDFGLVKDTSADNNQTTQVASFGGTPHFMPPEAVRSIRKMDGRSDLYSLGAVAYYLLTGQYVFDEENLMAVCVHHCETPPVPPSQRLGRSIDADLEQLVMQCLEKSPNDRPQAATQLRDNLLKCQAAGQWTQEQAHAWWVDYREDCQQHTFSDHAPTVDAAETIVIDTDQRAKD